MHEELKRAVEAARAHPERLEKNPENYSRYRVFLATHGDVLLAQADEIQRLRTQLAESEAACAGYRAALPNPLKLTALADLFDKVDRLAEQEGEGVQCDGIQRDLRKWADAIAQALQSNPGKAVGDVIAAAKRVDAALWNCGGDAGDRTLNRSWQELKAALARLEGRE